MTGVPYGRPGLAEVAGVAANDRRGQPDRRTAGKVEIDRTAARRGVRADRQKAEDAVLLAAVKTAVSDALDLLESDPAKRPLETGQGWMSVGLNTSYTWFAAVEDSRWAGHHFAFEVPRDPLSRAMRKAVAEAMKTFDESLPVLSRNERNEILRRAWPPELLR